MKDKPRIETLVANFERYLSYCGANPFGSDPIRAHIKTMNLRRRLGTASAALADDPFLDSLHATLITWRVESRGGILVELPEFRRQLRKHTKEIATLETIVIDNADANTGDRLWQIIRSLDIVLNRQTQKPTQSKIVGGSKALHHILPELMPPIDRQHTGQFLLRLHHFQNLSEQEETFRVAFESFREIAKKANPAQYVGRHERNTSRTKVIDDAIIGFVRCCLDQLNAKERVERPLRTDAEPVNPFSKILKASTLPASIRQIIERDLVARTLEPDQIIKSCRSAVVQIVGYLEGKNRTSIARKDLAGRIQELERAGFISPSTATWMHAVRRVRNEAEYSKGQQSSAADAKLCVDALANVLTVVFAAT